MTRAAGGAAATEPPARARIDERRPLRIGVMLRHLGQHEGGVKVYTQNIVQHLLAGDAHNRYVLLYNDERLLGSR